MQVLKTETDEGVADLTITFADDDHKFEVWAEGDTAYVEYQETLSFRGQVRVSEPDETVFKELVTSEEMTEFLEEYECEQVKRAKPRA